VADAHGHVIEEAKAHRRLAGGVVTGRPDIAEGAHTLAGGNPFGRRDHRTGRMSRGQQRLRIHHRVGIDARVTRQGRTGLDRVDVPAGMGAQQLFSRRRRRIDRRHQVEQAGAQEAVGDYSHPVRALGMACTHLVKRRTGVGKVCNVHALVRPP
jgi:hypothetical protein